MLGTERRLWQGFVGWGTVAGRLRPGGGGREARRPPEGLQTPAPASAAAGSAVPCGSGGDGGLGGGGGGCCCGGDGGAALRREPGQTQPDSGIRGVRRGGSGRAAGPGLGDRAGVFWHRLGDRDRGRATACHCCGAGVWAVCVRKGGSGGLFPSEGGGRHRTRTVHLPRWSLLHAQAGVSISLRLAAKVESPSGLKPGHCPPSALRFPSTPLSPSISPSD